MQNMTETAMIPELRKVLKRLHYPLEVMLVCARWYAAYVTRGVFAGLPVCAGHNGRQARHWRFGGNPESRRSRQSASGPDLP